MTRAPLETCVCCLFLACSTGTASTGPDGSGGAPRDAASERAHDARPPAVDARSPAIDARSPAIDAPDDARTTVDAAVDASRDAGSDAAWAFLPTTTVAELTQNNTSACGSSGSPCNEAWTPTHTVTYGSGSSYAGQTKTVAGFWNEAVPTGPRAPGSSEGRVSKVPMSALLPGYSVPIWVATQNWWSSSGHIDNGEVSSSAAQIADQIADQVSRGIAGQNVDWYGPGTMADMALPFIQSGAEATNGAYKFAVTIDKGYFMSCGETVACLNAAISYIAAHYATSSAYVTDADGHPLVFFFINSYYPTQYAVLQSPGVEPQSTKFVMYEPNGFPGSSPPDTVGEFGWVNPADGAALVQTTGSQGTFSVESDLGLGGVTNFFKAAEQNQGSTIVSPAYKGFDDNLASWSGDRIIDQQCGLTWLESFDHTAAFGGSTSYVANLNYLALGKRLDFVMVDTWDDYEEGSEIETGIDNCLASLTVTLSGSTLAWSPTWGPSPMNSAISGSEATVHEYAVYIGEPGSTALMPLTSLLCEAAACPHSLDVSTLGLRGGPYVFYVEAVGQPSIVNTLSPATSATYTAG
jgi:hypothetical protein